MKTAFALLLAITALLILYGCTGNAVQEQGKTVKHGVDVVKAQAEVNAAANGDTVEVEAKVRWAMFLADGWAPASQSGKP